VGSHLAALVATVYSDKRLKSEAWVGMTLLVFRESFHLMHEVGRA
jgi:hypothetical protein